MAVEVGADTLKTRLSNELNCGTATGLMLIWLLCSTIIPPPLPEERGRSNKPYPAGVSSLKRKPSDSLCQVSVKHTRSSFRSVIMSDSIIALLLTDRALKSAEFNRRGADEEATSRLRNDKLFK